MIRLAGGNTSNEGRVEIYHEKRWGSVCSHEFDDTDGNVVCQQLGYAKFRRHFMGNRGTGKIWLDDVNCSKSHVQLSDCGSRGWGVTDCHHDDDVSVICEGKALQNVVFSQAIQLLCVGSMVDAILRFCYIYSCVCGDNLLMSATQRMLTIPAMIPV